MFKGSLRAIASPFDFARRRADKAFDHQTRRLAGARILEDR
jgi:hypothetical protein